MTYEEAIKWFESFQNNIIYEFDMDDERFSDALKASKVAIKAIEKQRYISAKIEWLKTLNPYEMILVSDVLDWFEDAKVEYD